ncbi:DUF3365 domain-containing protein [Thiotrichales bacterium HSG1]|nr:DUF3365 domain-containing protein [Thiotrichales bacterium HSG1]
MLFIILLIPFIANATGEVGIAAKGGHPEYLFLDKVKQSEAKSTAYLISKAIGLGRLVIFAQMKKLTNPKLGDKGFTGEYFLEQWKTSLEPEMIDISPTQQGIIDKLFWAGKQSIDNNQDRINVKGVKWKHFLPAKWARETGLMFNSRTGIVTKQPSLNYRHPSNIPDVKERDILTEFAQSNAKARGEFAMMGKQKIYRYFDPIVLVPPCLACHGKPKGELDMLGFEKDGLNSGDVIGLISVSIAVEDQ